MYEDEKYHCSTFIRVKYLDPEDIQDLGWICEDEDNFLAPYVMKTYYLHYWKYFICKNDEITIEKENYCKIIQFNIPLFMGIVKNKSELKKIMQQIGIL